METVPNKDEAGQERVRQVKRRQVKKIKQNKTKQNKTEQKKITELFTDKKIQRKIVKKPQK